MTSETSATHFSLCEAGEYADGDVERESTMLQDIYRADWDDSTLFPPMMNPISIPVSPVVAVKNTCGSGGNGRVDRENCTVTGLEVQVLISAIDSFRTAVEHSTCRAEAAEARIEAQAAQLRDQTAQIKAMVEAKHDRPCMQCLDRITSEMQRAMHEVVHSVVNELKVSLQNVKDEFCYVTLKPKKAEEAQSKESIAVDANCPALGIDNQTDHCTPPAVLEPSSTAELEANNVLVDTAVECISEKVSRERVKGDIASQMSVSTDEASPSCSDQGKNFDWSLPDVGIEAERLPLPILRDPLQPKVPHIQCTRGSLEILNVSTTQSCARQSVERSASLGAFKYPHALAREKIVTPRSSRVRSAVSQWERKRPSLSSVGLEHPIPKAQPMERRRANSLWPFAVPMASVVAPSQLLPLC